jgi:sporulation protein YlmC with PRC-barrel domain
MEADFGKLEQIMGERVVDPRGHRIGKVTQLALEPQTLQAEWLVLKTSRFGRQRRLVPIKGAVDQGGAILVPFSKEMVLGAPVPAVPTSPGGSEVTALHAHYDVAA